MRAIIIEDYGGPEKMKLVTLNTPEPQENEVQIKVAYSGMNPVDWKIREGLLKERIPNKFPIILGWEAAGVVSKVGKNVTNHRVGDEVFGYVRKPLIQWGTYAEYVCFDSEHMVNKPENLTLAQAAGIPLNALTAWQAITEVGQVRPHKTILIHAGAGGVGGMAIQFAKHFGATVLTTARQSNHHYVKHLGADIAIDYSKQKFWEAVKENFKEGVDIVLDLVGGQTLEDSYQAVKKGGLLISIVSLPNKEKAKEYDIKTDYVFVRPNGEHLSEIAELIKTGKIKAPQIKEYPFGEAATALEEIKKGHTQGKLVLKVGVI